MDWLLDIRSRSIAPQQAARNGIEQCLRFGVTCVGDITQQIDVTRTIVAQSPIRCVSFGEVLGLARRRERFEQLLPQAINPSHQSEKLKIGLSPHSPYTVDLDGYRQCLQIAQRLSLPLATHLAESAHEREFLESHSGPFRSLWENLGTWGDGVATYPGSPIAMAQAIGLLDWPTLLAHVNYCDDRELEILSSGKASVVYCPRTHVYFGHPPHRWRQMLARGINVAIGTDSCGSSPDLNIVEDLRLLRRIAPDVPASELWKMATIRAAKALSMHDEVGSIGPGMRADFVAFEAAGNDPLEAVLQEPLLPLATWIDGIMCYQDRSGPAWRG